MSELHRSRGNVSILFLQEAPPFKTELFHRELLPDEDPETQAVLMRCVLEILMQVEHLTSTQRDSVKDNLVGLPSHPTGTITQPVKQRYAFLN